ncbi:unnamed protein product [Moneuplotes crassus]|uniref:Protein kinase domain-containing protein n=1 Tax=Euplotes crassus TaxID=5936 RepID=A0AAD1U9U7_EUPCR|nr:unnamed protein product [Moneuplotes crassus]
MDKSFLEKLKGLQDYDGDLFDKITKGDAPIDCRIENMEDDTIGFSIAFSIAKNRVIEFYTMNLQKEKVVNIEENKMIEGNVDLEGVNIKDTSPILMIERKKKKIKRVKFLSSESRSLYYTDEETGNGFVHFCCYWGLPDALKKVSALKNINLSAKNFFNKSPIEISFLKRKAKDQCYLFLKKSIKKEFRSELVRTGISLFADEDALISPSVACENLGILSPFTREFYTDLDYIKILKRDRFETLKESIIDINPSFTVLQGRYKGEPIVVREILEKYTTIRQLLSIISELKTLNLKYAKEHDSFMDILAVSLEKGKLYILYHNCSQMVLQKHIRKRYMLTDSDRLFIIKQLVLSLLYLHLFYDDPIIHGHINPITIFVEDTLDIKIGAVGQFLNGGNSEIDKWIKDDPYSNYVAPECFSNQISTFSDVFSFGCLMYELYTGEPAFEASCLEDYLRQIQEKDIQWNDDIPPRISYLVKKCVAYEHVDRPHILEIADFLEAL